MSLECPPEWPSDYWHLGLSSYNVANLVVAATFLTLESAFSRPATFWLYGACAAVGFSALALFMPETAKKKLEDIEKIFNAGQTAPAEQVTTSRLS